MFFELRQYTLWPGKQAAFVKLMDEVIIPFQTSVGMDIRGSWVAEEDETQFFWIRAFQSEAERRASLRRCLRQRHVEERGRAAAARPDGSRAHG